MTALGLSLSLIGCAASAAAAPSTEATWDGSAEGAVEIVAPSVLDNTVPVHASDLQDGAVQLAAGAGSVSVPVDADDLVGITNREGISVGVGLPFSESSSNGAVTGSGAVVYDNNNGTSTMPVIKGDGGVQITTVIESVEAPERFEYDLTIPAGATVQQFESGVVLILDANGELVAGAAPPWAKDASGADLPTRYEVDGSKLVQVVEHRGNTSVQYPVVADPFLGSDLFSWTGYNRNGLAGGQYVISMLKSTWGNLVWVGGVPSVGTVAAGQYIFQTAGWSELVSKRSRADDKPTIQHQYDCHVLYGYNISGAGVHWDLEMYRDNNPIWAIQSPLSHKCNW